MVPYFRKPTNRSCYTRSSYVWAADLGLWMGLGCRMVGAIPGLTELRGVAHIFIFSQGWSAGTKTDPGPEERTLATYAILGVLV